MGLWVYVILAVAALATSILSAIIGMGGGILMLAVLFSFLSHSEAIPTHAAVQIASNGTRILVFLKNVDWKTLGRFCIGVIPGGVIGVVILWKIGEFTTSEPYLKIVVGAYILIATFLPKGSGKTSASYWWDFPLLGFAAGTAALTVGAVGPLIAPMFARREFVKERLIATKATCQMVTHIMKIPAFIWVRQLDIANLSVLTLVMICMVIPGTILGRRIVHHVTPRHFTILYRVALTLAGTKVLFFDGLYKVLF